MPTSAEWGKTCSIGKYWLKIVNNNLQQLDLFSPLVLKFLKQKDSVFTSLNFSPRNIFAFSGKVGNPRLWKRLRLDSDKHSGN